jgi:hypothetical protein
MKKPIDPIAAAPRDYPKQAFPDEEAIRLLAHELWRARGCPIGSPEDDWYIAEQQLKKPLTAASGA